MTANVAAISALFGQRQSNKSSNGSGGAPFLSGPCPYVSLVNPGDYFTAAFVAVMEAVKVDPRWGPLFNGDLSPYSGNQSSGDMALCGEFARRGFDAHFVDMAIRSSKLYRAKWERDDYRNATISKALAGAPSTPAAGTTTTKLDPFGGNISVSTTAPPPRDYLIDDMLVRGNVAVLAGLGGASKSQLAIQLAALIILGERFCGNATRFGNVLGIFGEETQQEIERRIGAFALHQGLSASDQQAIEQGFRAYPLIGEDISISASDGRTRRETGFAEEIIDRANDIGGVGLIILDHLSLLYGGDFNAREDAALTMRVANRIGMKTKATVLVLAHSPKAAGNGELEESNATMVTGSSAFVDQARAAWILASMRPKEATRFKIPPDQRKAYVSLTVVKSNYGPTGDVHWFKRVTLNGCAVLDPLPMLTQTLQPKTYISLSHRIVALVKAHSGEYSKTRLRDTFSGKSRAPLKASKGAIETAIGTLLADGYLVERPPTKPERTTFNHGPRVKLVLDVP